MSTTPNTAEQAAKHTPGPSWYAEKPDRCCAGMIRIRSTACDRPVVAVLHPMRSSVSVMMGAKDSYEANARLIAAAPELLAALKGILEHNPDDYRRNSPADKAWKAVAAAIAKAEGRT